MPILVKDSTPAHFFHIFYSALLWYCRLRAYDRNKDFQNEPVIIPEPLEVDWPTRGFQQLQVVHRGEIPEICIEQIDMYFVHRLAGMFSLNIFMRCNIDSITDECTL